MLPARGHLLRLSRVGPCLGICAFLVFAGCKKDEPIDEAKAAGKSTADFPQITADIFKPMDGGINLSPEEIMGRNTWNLWSGGNEHFWNHAAQDSFGLMDLLKMLDNRKFPRGERFKVLGLVNEPGFRAASKPDEFGLWLDEEVEPEPAGIDRTVYGKPSGVLGFRLFPNPDFNEEARKKWNGDRFMNDPAYYNDNKLIRPYRVGVACGSCHIAPNPSNPPLDPENPRWENLASAIGNQYINEGKVFACNVEKGGFFYEMLAAQPRGTSDTSRIATDHINNPNAINPIFLLAERERIAVPEKMAGGTLALPGEKEEMPVPHILKDGADSIGVPGATIRVYVNIGMFSEYWLTRHNRLIGLTPQKPFEIAYAREHSVFWRATEERLANIAAFFRRLQPFHLADAPGGQAYITTDAAVMTRGKEVFAESCAACHSSKQPRAERRSALGRRESVVPRGGDGARFSGKQFSFERQALSTDQNRNQFGARVRELTRRPVTSGTISPRSHTKSSRRWTSSNFSTRLMRRIRSNSSRKKKMSARDIIACRRWSAFGVPRRYCTTTRWENLPAILRWRAESTHLTMRSKNCSGRKSG